MGKEDKKLYQVFKIKTNKAKLFSLGKKPLCFKNIKRLFKEYSFFRLDIVLQVTHKKSHLIYFS